MTEQSAGQQWTRESFRRAFGQAIFEIHKNKAVQHSMGNVLSLIGIPEPKVTGERVEFTIPAQDPDEPIGRNGVKWSDLSEAAQRRIDQERLTSDRRRAYTTLRDYAQTGLYPADLVIPHLAALGFPEPTQKTTVEANVTLPDGTRKAVAFTLPRAVTSDEVKEALDQVAGTSPARDLVLSAFEDAEGMPEPVSRPFVSTSQEWASSGDVS